MKKSAIIPVITLTLCILGITLAVIGLLLGGRFDRNFTEEVTHRVTGEFDRIKVNVTEADVRVEISDNGECYAVCDESEKINYTFEINGTTLTLNENDDRKWYDHIGITLGGKKVTVYLPVGEYEALSVSSTTGMISCNMRETVLQNAVLESTTGKIGYSGKITAALDAKVTTGSIEIDTDSPNSVSLTSTTGRVVYSGTSVNSLTAKATTGSVIINNTAAEVLKITATTGSVTVNRVTVADAMDIKTTTGSITLNGCDGEDISLEATTGNINATLLSGKMFSVHTGTGSAQYPDSVEGSGKFSAKATTGSVKVKIAG